MAKKPKLEHSELAGEFTDDGITVLVDIYRPAGPDGGWSLEVISENDDLTTWEEQFSTDEEAFGEFLATVAREGIEIVPRSRSRCALTSPFRANSFQ